MNKKVALLLGSQSGIAGSLAKLMSKEYDIKIVSRSSNENPGDLTNCDFRDQLAKSFSPEVIVSAFGNWTDCKTIGLALSTFFESNVDLFEKFKKCENLKTFVIVSSAVAKFSAHPTLSENELNYLVSKRLLSDYFQQLQLWGKNRVNIVLSEPGFINSNFANIRNRNKGENISDILNIGKINPIEPNFYAEYLYSLIKLKTDVTTTLFNHIGNYFKT